MINVCVYLGNIITRFSLLYIFIRWQRKPTDPVTPDKNRQSSTRAWQGQVRQWRRALHVYDDPEAKETFTADEAALCKM